MGETVEQRAELAAQLAAARAGRGAAELPQPAPGHAVRRPRAAGGADALRTVAAFRLALPRTVLRFAGGREITLGDLGARQGLLGGINAVIVGNYLTTLGPPGRVRHRPAGRAADADQGPERDAVSAPFCDRAARPSGEHPALPGAAGATSRRASARSARGGWSCRSRPTGLDGPVQHARRARGRLSVVLWTSVWEDDVDDHAELAALLARAFPQSRTPRWRAAVVERAAGAAARRPSDGQVGRARRRPAAVPADRRAGRSSSATSGWSRSTRRATARGLGAALLAQSGRRCAGWGMPFGFLTCGEQVAGFYARGGWARVPGPTRMIRADGRMQVYGGVSMVLALATPLDAWPSGRIDRNGWEV